MNIESVYYLKCGKRTKNKTKIILNPLVIIAELRDMNSYVLLRGDMWAPHLHRVYSVILQNIMNIY